ncbi:hypothetical protein RFN30_11170 [Mesorhizobium sp. VK23D]|nr:hypothetical protein [Mesorhizobium sp. VK23D]
MIYGIGVSGAIAPVKSGNGLDRSEPVENIFGPRINRFAAFSV